jgi:hypothetical protein
MATQPDASNPTVAWLDEEEDTEAGGLKSNLTWMPMAREQTVPLASLTVCNVNVHKGCNFHIEKKFEAYRDSWQNPAPLHCQRGRKKRKEPVIHSDRLGMTFDCKAFD